MRFILVLLCVLASLASSVPDAGAVEAGGALVVLVDPGVPELARRLREEIESLGFEVVNVREDGAQKPLELRARAVGAVAAIRLTLSGPGAVDMSIVDRATGKTVSRRLSIVSSSDPAAAELIATRTVELLRASFMELAAAHPARGDVPAPAQVQALSVVGEAPRTSASVSLAAGPALAFNGGGFGPSLGVWSALTVFVRPELAFTGELILPVTDGELVRDEGLVELSAVQYRIAGIFALGSQRSRLSARFLTGVSVVRLTFRGSAEPPYSGVSEDLTTFGPWGGVRGRLRISESFSASLGGDASFLFPGTVVRAAGREVANFGRPSGALVSGLELTWH